MLETLQAYKIKVKVKNIAAPIKPQHNQREGASKNSDFKENKI